MGVKKLLDFPLLILGLQQITPTDGLFFRQLSVSFKLQS
jgi:hypothetical protein